MTVAQALREAARRLSPHSNSPRLDGEVLLGHLLGWDRARLLAHGEFELSAEQAAAYESKIERRGRGEPVAYLVGHREFYGVDLLVTPDVLVPRPETESVVDACLEYICEGEISQMADIGTGSGAIVVATCKLWPMLRAFATDLSKPAIAVALENAKRHGVAEQITFLHGDLLEPLPHAVGLIAANLPYVPPGEAAPDVAAWEPQLAVFGGGEDGTELIRRFLSDVPRYLLPDGRVVMETAHSQGAIVSELAKSAFPNAEIEIRKDLAGYDRIVVIQT
jgi:release factor glutamine methyltransferase